MSAPVSVAEDSCVIIQHDNFALLSKGGTP